MAKLSKELVTVLLPLIRNCVALVFETGFIESKIIQDTKTYKNEGNGFFETSNPRYFFILVYYV